MGPLTCLLSALLGFIIIRWSLSLVRFYVAWTWHGSLNPLAVDGLLELHSRREWVIAACWGGQTGTGSSRGLIQASNSQLRTGIFFANEQNVSWTQVHVSTEKIPTIWGGYWCSSSNEEEEFCASESSIYSRCIILCASHSYSFVRATNQSYDLNSLHWLYHVLGACYLLCSLLSGKFDKLCGKGAKSWVSFQVNQFRVNLHLQKWVGGLQASRVKQSNELLHGVSLLEQVEPS